MRLFLLPVSTRRTLIYCERIQEQINGAKPSIHDRVVNKANATWTQWEKSETKWKLRLTEYGNRIFNRIDYREWGLKTLPHTVNKDNLSTIEVLYPSNFLQGDRVPSILKAIATERQSLHQKRMFMSIAAMPFTIPVGLLPVYVKEYRTVQTDNQLKLSSVFLTSHSYISVRVPNATFLPFTSFTNRSSVSRMVALQGSVRATCVS